MACPRKSRTSSSRQARPHQPEINHGVEVAEGVPSDALIRLLTLTLANTASNEVQERILSRLGIPVDKRLHAIGTFEKHVDSLTKTGIRVLAVELVLQTLAPWHDYQRHGAKGPWDEALEAVQVDFKSIEKRIADELKAKEKARASKKKTAKRTTKKAKVSA